MRIARIPPGGIVLLALAIVSDPLTHKFRIRSWSIGLSTKFMSLYTRTRMVPAVSNRMCQGTPRRFGPWAEDSAARFGVSCRIVWLLLFFACLGAESTLWALPNLTPYKPTYFSDKIVVSRTAGNYTDSPSLTTADTLYLDWAVINSGDVAAGAFYTYLYVDGVYKTYGYAVSLGANTYTYWNDYSIGSLSAGTHTISITADATYAVTESNESDNSYTKTITVGSPILRT